LRLWIEEALSREATRGKEGEREAGREHHSPFVYDTASPDSSGFWEELTAVAETLGDGFRDRIERDALAVCERDSAKAVLAVMLAKEEVEAESKEDGWLVPTWSEGMTEGLVTQAAAVREQLTASEARVVQLESSERSLEASVGYLRSEVERGELQRGELREAIRLGRSGRLPPSQGAAWIEPLPQESSSSSTREPPCRAPAASSPGERLWEDMSTPPPQEQHAKEEENHGSLRRRSPGILPEVPRWVPGSFLERSRLVIDSHSSSLEQPGRGGAAATAGLEPQQGGTSTPDAWQGSFRGFCAYSDTLDRARERVSGRAVQHVQQRLAHVRGVGASIGAFQRGQLATTEGPGQAG